MIIQYTQPTGNHHKSKHNNDKKRKKNRPWKDLLRVPGQAKWGISAQFQIPPLKRMEEETGFK